MLENVSDLGVAGFYTYHYTEGNSFRPCATRLSKESAIEATKVESQEIKYISSKFFPSVLFSGIALGDFKLPIHLHPFMWQKRTSQDVYWYNKKNVIYTAFYNYRDDSLKYIPKELSIYHEKKNREGLTFSPQEGYSFDKNIERAKIKAVMELIEKDVITLWWHRETSSRSILIDDADNELLFIKNKLLTQGIELTILEIENDLGVYVVVCILRQSEYPLITYGSAAHFNIKEAIKYAIFEAVSCIVGLRYEFIHLKKTYNNFVYPNFIKSNQIIKLSDYQLTMSLETAINQYDIYYTYISTNEGHLVKAYCFELQPTLYCDTVPLTKRFFKASEQEIIIKEYFPFL